MANYLHQASGLINSSFPWSVRMYSTSAESESGAETVWHNGFNTFWSTTAFLALIPTTVTWTGTYTSTMSTAWKQTTKTATSASVAGTGTGSLPYQVCENITWRTAQATKYGRGRWYLPVMAPAALATGGYVLSATAVGDIVTAINAGLTTWVPNLTFVILHRRATLTGPGALTTDNITGGDVPNRFGIQRRRADKAVPTRSTITL